MEKRVMGAAVPSSLPSPGLAAGSAAPIVGVEGLQFFGVSIADWVYLLVAIFYFVSAIHVVYKIYVRHQWAKANINRDGIVNVRQVVDNSSVNAKIVVAERKRKGVSE